MVKYTLLFLKLQLQDSSHVNTPIGAQGMNAGMQDTFNLAWKLAFVLSENLPDLIKELAEE